MTHLATDASSHRTGQSLAHTAPSTAKTPMTVRLPDLSGARKSARPHEPASGKEIAKSSAAAIAQAVDPSGAAARPVLVKEVLFAKVVGVVRQPKFWLACVVFLAVQVILALVVPPREEEPPPFRVEVTTKSPETDAPPAARIVVPAASTPMEVLEPAPAAEGLTTPMGAALPTEPGDAKAGDPSTAMEDSGLPAPPTRMADSRGLGEGGQFDGRALEPDGATLGGILPLAPNPEMNSGER